MNTEKAYEAYALFMALKLHFTQEYYDFVRYNGKANSINSDSFLQRNDRFFFNAMAKRYDNQRLKNFYISNLYIKPEIWIQELIKSKNLEENLLRKERFDANPTEEFHKDIKFLLREYNNPKNMLVAKSGEIPPIMTSIMRRDIHPETFIFMDSALGLVKIWESLGTLFPTWDKKKMLLEKYSAFVTFDRTEFTNILVKELNFSLDKSA